MARTKSPAKPSGPIEIPFYETPERLGCKPCPNCGPGADLRLKAKKLTTSAFIAEIRCLGCMREAATELTGSASTAVKTAIKIWNGIKPDIDYFLDAPSEGVKYVYG